MNSKNKSIKPVSSSSEIDAFLNDARSMTSAKQKGAGNLVFAMDATFSREPTWDMACQIQGEMFLATDKIANLNIKLAYYGGFNTFKVSNWVNNAAQMLKLMRCVRCEGGKTQIGRVLKYTLEQTNQQSIDALVFVGDCMEENADTLSDLAGRLGLIGVPIFIFQEGSNQIASKTFKHMCKLSKGAYCSFDAGSAEQLRALLGAVAIYATGGKQAFLDYAKDNKIAGLLE